jgi:hypothetical protein
MQNLQRIVGVFGAVLLLLVVTIAIMLSIAVPSGPVAEIERFSGYPAGLIVTGENSGTGKVSEDLFPNLHLSASKHDGTPATLTLQEAGTGNLLIIADDLRDEAPRDGYLDQPRIAAAGGELIIQFDLPTTIEGIAVTRMTERSNTRLTLYHGIEKLGQLTASGRSSERNVFKLNRFGPMTKLEVYFSGPGAIEQIEFQTEITPTETESWGKLKRLFGN